MSALSTIGQAAELLDLKVSTLYGMVATRRIPHVRLGPRLVRFSRKARREIERLSAVIDPSRD